MWITKSKLKDIERQLEKLSDRCWMLENPPKFKKGDIVEVEYKSQYTGYGYNYIGKVINYPYYIGKDWRYDILVDDEIKKDEEAYMRIAEQANLSQLQAETPESNTNVPKSGESA